MKFCLSLIMLFLMATSGAIAVEPDEVLADPALEARARVISSDLRCLVCQNQSIDDSDAELARDLRLLVRERLLSGDSDAQVKSYLVDRYGEFVLLRPAFAGHTLILWFAGPLVLLVGALIVFLSFRERNKSGQASNGENVRMTKEEKAALSALSQSDEK